MSVYLTSVDRQRGVDCHCWPACRTYERHRMRLFKAAQRDWQVLDMSKAGDSLFPASEQRFLGKAGEVFCAVFSATAFLYLIASIAVALVRAHSGQ